MVFSISIVITAALLEWPYLSFLCFGTRFFISCFRGTVFDSNSLNVRGQLNKVLDPKRIQHLFPRPIFGVQVECFAC